MEDVTALRAGWHRHRRVPSDCRYAQLRAERELRIGHQHFGVEVLAVALEPRIVGDLEQDVYVAARSAARARVADAAQRHVLPGRDSRRDLDAQLMLAAYPSLAAAVLARRLHDPAFAVAGGTRHHRDELSEERALRAPYFALPAARRATLSLGPRLGARALASLARLELPNENLLLDSARERPA